MLLKLKTCTCTMKCLLSEKKTFGVATLRICVLPGIYTFFPWHLLSCKCPGSVSKSVHHMYYSMESVVLVFYSCVHVNSIHFLLCLWLCSLIHFHNFVTACIFTFCCKFCGLNLGIYDTYIKGKEKGHEAEAFMLSSSE